ncbi:serine/arginine repetitive matrix protein 1-like [Microplitis mediator]|uniref:serine/arginine repetitive matrix protein 1-like n=1 Tax=Microplitis mediator TaxID=375433 RepID=UPI002553DF3D|nr:serine/arginine repetitive matrix protein 1-like [Microplitis mediator]
MPPKRRPKAKAPKAVHPALQESEAEREITLEEAKNRIVELEEQLRQMTLASQTQNQDVNNPPANPTRNLARNRAASVAVSSPGARRVRRGSASAVKKDQNAGCSCTGNCGTKRCGCVKKDKVCNEFCKCADACQNKGNASDGSDDDDKENENVQTSTNVDVKNRGKKAVPLTPAAQTKKGRRANVISDSSTEGTPSPMESVAPRSLFDTPVVENKSNNESFSSHESNEAEERVPINPMKPKHQLLRSPVVRSPMATRSRSKSPNPIADPARNDDSDDDDDYDDNGLATSKAETSSSSQSSSASTDPLQPKHKLARSPVDRKVLTRSQSRSPNPPADRVHNDYDNEDSSIPKADTSSSSQSSLSAEDPLKPKHKLMRSPIAGTSNAGRSSKSPNMPSNTSVFHDDDVFLPVPKPDPAELSTSLPPPPEIFKEEVDWSEHKSQLVKCRKCQRNFFPYRIAVHEKNCIKI